MSIITALDDDMLTQYLDSRKLLSTAVFERDRLRQEFETLAKVPQGESSGETIAAFDIKQLL